MRSRNEFDARGGWNGGFRSCAHWLSWRVGLDLHLDANTARPTWSGERLDVGYAIGVLHPRALVPRSEAVPAPRGDRER
jgi:hypothetical protein